MSRARPEGFPALAVRGPSLDRRLWNGGLIGLCYLSTALLMVPLALIIWHLLANGLTALTPRFFIHMPKPVGEPGGGMANAIVGTLMLTGIGLGIAVPVGVGTGVCLAEHGQGRFGHLV